MVEVTINLIRSGPEIDEYEIVWPKGPTMPADRVFFTAPHGTVITQKLVDDSVSRIG